MDGISEAAHRFDDRNRIYHVRFVMCHSAHHANDVARARYETQNMSPGPNNCTNSSSRVYEHLRYIVNKYAPWLY